MNKICERLTKVIEAMKALGLANQTVDLEKVKEMTRKEKDDEEDSEDRPLYKATPTGIPGTWVEPDGDVIKTSKD